jgi:glutaredoxin-like protein
MIKVIGARWCGDCIRVIHFLETHQIPYQWVDIDKDTQAEQFVIKVNHGFRSVPTIIFEDGSLLVEPSTRELEDKINSL